MSSESEISRGDTPRGFERADTERATSSPGQQTPYLRIFKSNVFVRDHDQCLKFYVDQLGFSVVADGRFEFDRWVAIALPDGSTILAVIAPKRARRTTNSLAGIPKLRSSPKISMPLTSCGAVAE